MVDIGIFKQDLVEILMSKITIEEKQKKMNAFVELYKSFFKHIGIEFVTVEPHPRTIIISYRTDTIVKHCSVGIFLEKFNPSEFIEYNRLITINNIINE